MSNICRAIGIQPSIGPAFSHAVLHSGWLLAKPAFRNAAAFPNIC
jgi:hypothetical protein